MAMEDAKCPICLETMFPAEEVSISFCKHYTHLGCWNSAERPNQRTRCCLCRRYEPGEEEVWNILIISRDPRASGDTLLDQIETRGQFSRMGQLLLKDFEDGKLSSEALEQWARATLRDDDGSYGQGEETKRRMPELTRQQ